MVHSAGKVKSVNKGGSTSKNPKQVGKMKNGMQKLLVDEEVCWKKMIQHKH